MEDTLMSNHKLIIENWRRFLSENDRGYRTTALDGGDLYLLEKIDGRVHKLILYTFDLTNMSTDKIDGSSLWMRHNDVGAVTILPADRKPCIPDTYEVGTIHVAPEYSRKGYGSLLYDLAFYIVSQKDGGLTSDRTTGSKTLAVDFWKSVESNEAKYEKRKTQKIPIKDIDLDYVYPKPEDGATHIGGRDTFDYDESTPDPDDDCVKDSFDNATDHSFALRDVSKIKPVYDKLLANNDKLFKAIATQAGGDKIADSFVDMIIDKTVQGFEDAYMNAYE